MDTVDFTRLYHQVRRAAANRVPDQAADDVAHDALIVILETELPPGVNAIAYAAGVVRHLAARYFRASGRQVRLAAEAAHVRHERSTRRLADLWLPAVLAHAKLSPVQVEVLRLYYEDGLNARRIAGRLGLPEGTVRGRLAAVRARLRCAHRWLQREQRPWWLAVDLRSDACELVRA